MAEKSVEEIEADIAGLDEKLEALDETMEELNDDIVKRINNPAAEAEVVRMQAKYTQHLAELDQFRKRKGTLEQMLTTAQAREAEARQAEALTNKAQTNADSIAGLNAKVGEMEAKVAQLEARLDQSAELVTAINNLTDTVGRLRSEDTNPAADTDND